MLNNIDTAENLRGIARARSLGFEAKTISKALLPEYEAEKWVVERENTSSFRVVRTKSHSVEFEDRVWSLLYRMGFEHLSGVGGATLLLDPKNPEGPKNQLDAVAIDGEVAVAVECKSATVPTKRTFMQDLAKFVQFRSRFSQYVKKQFGDNRSTVLVFWTRNILLSDNDKERAKKDRVVLLDEKDLEYYEKLFSHIGDATRYQLLADILEGREIPGLSIRVPAVEVKMGGNHCYTFSISPEYLLKIAYVSHRMKGKADGVEAYQRLLRKARLNSIRQFIQEEDGIFPTNIVVNLPRRSTTFQRVKQEGEKEGGRLGWLDIKPSYKSAWIIDGQHRLFAYSGLREAQTAAITVLAFTALTATKQAELFIEINSQQKKVSQSLLETLYAALHWDSEDVHERIGAIISKTVQLLGKESDSVFHDRIQSADEPKTEVRCITLTSLFGAIEKSSFFIAKERHGEVVEYGPLWAINNEATVTRTYAIVNAWFTDIAVIAAAWWDKGSGEGGGLAMNDGVVSLLGVLKSVIDHLASYDLGSKPTADVVEVLKPYAAKVGEYLNGMSDAERKMFRDLRGGAGQLKRLKMCQAMLRDSFKTFNPPGLDDFLEAQRQETNAKSKEILEEIEKTLQATIIEELQREFSAAEDDWWRMGIPEEVRKKVVIRKEEDNDKRGGREYYFNLIDYKHIASANWKLFEKLLGIGAGGKDKKLSWLNFVNEKRNAVYHVTASVTISVEDFTLLKQYRSQLRSQIEEPPEYVMAATAASIEPSDGT